MPEQGRPNFFPLRVLELKGNGLPNRPKANKSFLQAGPHDFILSGRCLESKENNLKKKTLPSKYEVSDRTYRNECQHLSFKCAESGVYLEQIQLKMSSIYCQTCGLFHLK